MLKQIITSPTFIAIVTGQLRHFATIAGTALATNGIIGGDQVQAVSGAFVTIAAALLSAVSKARAA